MIAGSLRTLTPTIFIGKNFVNCMYVGPSCEVETIQLRVYIVVSIVVKFGEKSRVAWNPPLEKEGATEPHA